MPCCVVGPFLALCCWNFLGTTHQITSSKKTMAERKYTHGLELSLQGSTTLISIGEMEIWDGADLSLIRDTIVQLVASKNNDEIGIDMQHVQHVPSGFFGMLFDWHERGVVITLHRPRARVCQMLWFRKFFKFDQNDSWYLYEGEGIDEFMDEELWNSSDYVSPRPSLSTTR